MSMHHECSARCQIIFVTTWCQLATRPLWGTMACVVVGTTVATRRAASCRARHHGHLAAVGKEGVAWSTHRFGTSRDVSGKNGAFPPLASNAKWNGPPVCFSWTAGFVFLRPPVFLFLGPPGLFFFDKVGSSYSRAVYTHRFCLCLSIIL